MSKQNRVAVTSARVRASRRRAETVGPTPERLAKNDLEIVPIRYGDQRDADPSRPVTHRAKQRRDNPLDEFRRRRLISDEGYAIGQTIRRLRERTTRGIGCVNLNGTGGGSAQGLAYARLEAMSELNALLSHAGGPEETRVKRGSLLVAICGDGWSIRAYAGTKSRDRELASEVLISGLENIARAIEVAA